MDTRTTPIVDVIGFLPDGSTVVRIAVITECYDETGVLLDMSARSIGTATIPAGELRPYAKERTL